MTLGPNYRESNLATYTTIFGSGFIGGVGVGELYAATLDSSHNYGVDAVAGLGAGLILSTVTTLIYRARRKPLVPHG